MTVTRFSEQDSGRTAELAVGETVEISLPENPTAGFRWTVTAVDRAVCEVVADERVAPDTSIPGAPGEHRWTVRGVHSGECALELGYGRSWQRGASPARVFRLRLRVRAA